VPPFGGVYTHLLEILTGLVGAKARICVRGGQIGHAGQPGGWRSADGTVGETGANTGALWGVGQGDCLT